MTDTIARIKQSHYSTDALAIAALSGKLYSRVFSEESKTWFYNNNGTIEQEKEYQAQIDAANADIGSVEAGLTATQSDVSTLYDAVVALEATVSTIPAGPQGERGPKGNPGSSDAFGAFCAPLGSRFAPITAEATANPMLYSEYTHSALFSTGKITYLIISTAIIQAEFIASGSTNLTLDITDTGGGYVSVTLTGTSGEIGVSTIPVLTPGTYAIESDTPGETIAFIVTGPDGIASTDLLSATITLVGDDFSITSDTLATESFPNQGKGSRWTFENDFKCEWDNGATIEILLHIGGFDFDTPINLTGNYWTISEVPLTLRTSIQYLGWESTGSGPGRHTFRATVYPISDPNHPLDNPFSLQVTEGAVGFDDMPTTAWFSMTVKSTTTVTDPVTTFALLGASATSALK